MQGYERDPRSAAKRAEAYLRSTGIADEAFFGPGERVLHLRRRSLGGRDAGAFYAIDSIEGFWQSGKEREEGNMGHRPGIKGGYFPFRPSTRLQDIRVGDVPRARGDGPRRRSASPRGRARRAVRDRREIRRPREESRRRADAQVRCAERRAQLRQDGHVHAEASRRRQRQRHARSPVAGEGRQELVHGRHVRRPVAARAALHRRHPEARSRAQRVHEPDHEQLQAAR